MLAARFLTVLRFVRRQAVALFVTFHIVCVVLIALPKPPATDPETLKHPEVQAEMRFWIDLVGQEGVERVLTFVRDYTRWALSAERRALPYLELAGSKQSWHMFGGTPPRFPLVFVVEIRSRGEKDYLRYQDLEWGTRDSAAMNFRHRKVHENLCAPGWEGDTMWGHYARYWADRWDREHPEQPAAAVRLSATQWTTPTPEEVRAGNADRKPKTGLEVHVWSRP